MGATYTLQIKPGVEPEAVAKQVAEVLGGAPGRSIECSGAQFSVDLGVYVSNYGLGTMTTTTCYCNSRIKTRNSPITLFWNFSRGFLKTLYFSSVYIYSEDVKF